MGWRRGLLAVVVVLLASGPATAMARPADVNVVNVPTVVVRSSASAPIVVTDNHQRWQTALQVSTGVESSGCSVFPQPPDGKAVLLESAYVSTSPRTTAFARMQLTGHFDAGGSFPLFDVTLPALDGAGTTRLTGIDLAYIGGLATSRPTAELQSLFLCWLRPASSTNVSVTVMVSGRLYSPTTSTPASSTRDRAAREEPERAPLPAPVTAPEAR